MNSVKQRDGKPHAAISQMGRDTQDPTTYHIKARETSEDLWYHISFVFYVHIYLAVHAKSRQRSKNTDQEQCEGNTTGKL